MWEEVRRRQKVADHEAQVEKLNRDAAWARNREQLQIASDYRAKVEQRSFERYASSDPSVYPHRPLTPEERSRQEEINIQMLTGLVAGTDPVN